MTWNTTHIVVTLPPSTEEWAEEVVCAGRDHDWIAERDEGALTFKTSIGGNCNAVALVASAMRDLEEGLAEGNIGPSEVTVNALQTPASGHGA